MSTDSDQQIGSMNFDFSSVDPKFAHRSSSLITPLLEVVKDYEVVTDASTEPSSEPFEHKFTGII